MATKNIVFKPQNGKWPTHEDLDYQLAAAERETGLAFDYESSEIGPGGEPAVHYWDEAGDHGFVQYALDDYYNLAYATIELDDEKKLEMVIRAISEKLPIYSLDELRKQAKSEGPGDGALLALAMAQGSTFERELFDLVVSALRGRGIEKRREAAAAAGVLCWPELREPLQHGLDKEKDKTTGSVIAAALKSCGTDTGKQN